MYKFIKVKNPFGAKGHQWFFEPENVSQIIEHFEKYFGREVKLGIKDKMTEHHAVTPWRNVVDVTQGAYLLMGRQVGKSWLRTAIELEDQTLKDRVNYFTTGRKLYLAAGLSYTIPNDNEEFMSRIVKTVEQETLQFPEDKLSASEARYLKWDYGKHWYAKIRDLDVVDKDGNQKWSSKIAAQEAVKWFVRKENKNR